MSTRNPECDKGHPTRYTGEFEINGKTLISHFSCPEGHKVRLLATRPTKARIVK